MPNVQTGFGFGFHKRPGEENAAWKVVSVEIRGINYIFSRFCFGWRMSATNRKKCKNLSTDRIGSEVSKDYLTSRSF